MRSIVVTVPYTNARGKALLRLGFESEAIEKKPGSGRAKGRMAVWRSDGRDMITTDIRAARAVLKG